jgi:membrane-associated PAP2 superfamily phosphatase
MGKLTKNLSLAAVIGAYLLFNFRYAPESWLASTKATLMQLLTTVPYIAGLTILLVSVLKKMAGKSLPWDRIVRIYCTIGILIGFFFAMSEYWLKGQ